MPLRTRRRVKAAPASSRATQCESHVVGQSFLEQLPLEILTRIFLESQNTSFVQTSKSIYARIGHQPSEWLFLTFFGYNWEAKCDRECLARAVETRGFTLQFFTAWVEKFGFPTRAPPPQSWEIYPMSVSGEVFLQKRWVKPENEELLISLLRHRKIAIMPKFLRKIFPAAATLDDALMLFWDPSVTLKWPLEIMDHFGEQNRMHYMADGKCEVLREVLCSAVQRPDVTAQSLNTLRHHRTYETTNGSWSDIYDVALRTGKRDIIQWAVDQGFIPTAEQLRKLLLNFGYIV